MTDCGETLLALSAYSLVLVLLLVLDSFQVTLQSQVEDGDRFAEDEDDSKTLLHRFFAVRRAAG